MRDRYALEAHAIEIDKHPKWETHYIQKVNIVDATTREVVETVMAFDTDCRVAVQQARKLAVEWITEQNKRNSASLVSVPPNPE